MFGTSPILHREQILHKGKKTEDVRGEKESD